MGAVRRQGKREEVLANKRRIFLCLNEGLVFLECPDGWVVGRGRAVPGTVTITSSTTYYGAFLAFVSSHPIPSYLVMSICVRMYLGTARRQPSYLKRLSVGQSASFIFTTMRFLGFFSSSSSFALTLPFAAS